MSGKDSKRDIAKQFDLPERQSKIATLLKETDVYCICRTTDSTSFMIACDNCEEWYHGHCINITEPESRLIKRYFCPPCMENNSDLEIEYKKSKVSAPKPKPSKPAPAAVKRSAKQPKKVGAKKEPTTASREKPKRKVKKRKPSSTEEDLSLEYESESEDERQCFGIDCINPARPNSKYCSQDCCVRLAASRLFRILPGRIQEWNLTPSVAEDHNKRDLEDVRQKLTETRNRISELEKKRFDIDQHVLAMQKLSVDPAYEDDEPEEDGYIHCISCGHEIAVKSCIKHMERCYNKYESQTSFGSIYKTKLEGTPIFCDFFNPATGTYCKRLQVLCPEHSKEPKIREGEICGCPLMKNVSESTGKFCKLPKKKCNKHFCWEKLRRAEIDMERVRNWLKLDELLEQERQLRLAMSNRGGVMGLLLHSTFDHDLRNRIQTQMQQEGYTIKHPLYKLDKSFREPGDKTDDSEKDDGKEEEKEVEYVRAPLQKPRHKGRPKVVPHRGNKKEELTASKLYKKLVASKVADD